MRTPNAEDDEGLTLLVLRAQCGEIPALEQLLRRMHGSIRQYVIKLAGESQVDDILQETSFKIFRQIRHLREPKVFMAWAFRIATRVAFVHLRKEKRWRDIENEPDLAFFISPPGNAEGDEDFLRLVDLVSPASRAVLLLHCQQHLSLDETAAILDIPIGTAKSRLAYGVATIRKFVKGENPS